MPDRGVSYGFEELGPQQMAEELFTNHQPGDKVAIISRFSDGLDTYVQALEDVRKLKVRIIKGQVGIQDFCFLMRAKSEIIGVGPSTYATWAGILGDAQRVRLYSVDSTARRSRGSKTKFFHYYNYTNEELKSRFSFELYKMREEDEGST